MSNISQFPSQTENSEREAGDWVAKLGRGLTQAEELEFGDWLGKSRRNRELLLDLAKVWDDMDDLSRLADLFPEPVTTKPLKTGFMRLGWPIAASVLLSLSLVSWFVASTESKPIDAVVEIPVNPALYTTDIGQQARYELADGSIIVLNTDSEVWVNYTPTNRLLRLVRGEVHVTVAHNMGRPLSIMAGDKVVQAVGTEFNLEITSEHTIELLVSDGLVMVGVMETPIEEQPEDRPLMLTPESKLFSSGQAASITMDQPRIESVEPRPIDSQEISVKLSWRDGNLIFRGESLEEAVSEVGRYTAVEFVFLDEKAKQVRVAGLFKAGDVDGLLSALRNHFNISYEWQGDNRIVLSAE